MTDTADHIPAPRSISNVISLASLPPWRRLFLKAARANVRYTETALHLLDGPAILTCNHESLLDGLMIAAASPVPLSFPVNPNFSVNNRLTSRGLAYLQRRGLGRVIPMSPESYFSARRLLSELRQGRSVMIFPQGKLAALGADEPKWMRGAAWLHEQTGYPILRAEIQGARRSRFFALAGQELRPRISITI
tara:strand:- start:3934 stop:4509 length:576 start_codon:yes stop_codon:yes gene_type:complete